jgi:mono/diheme cytochrome c family protein
MPSYANRIDPPDRWLIAAYIQALQLSQHAELSDVPEAERSKLEGSK